VTISVSDFEIDRLEVSQARYQACVHAGACTAPDVEHCVYGNGSRPTDGEWAVLGRPEHPVVCVTFHQAEAYCRWAKGHVPTEAEWERAARGADGRMFPWGNDWRPSALNWGDDGQVDGHGLTAPVGSYPTGASPYGALDMVGNVWEWAYRLDALDTDVQADRQVIRGGGFAAAPHAQRTTKRAAYIPAQPYPNVGFRCAYGGTNPSPAHR
jgi:formylglycine-generating enzyme required for sulfatase activity